MITTYNLKVTFIVPWFGINSQPPQMLRIHLPIHLQVSKVTIVTWNTVTCNQPVLCGQKSRSNIVHIELSLHLFSFNKKKNICNCIDNKSYDGRSMTFWLYYILTWPSFSLWPTCRSHCNITSGIMYQYILFFHIYVPDGSEEWS